MAIFTNIGLKYHHQIIHFLSLNDLQLILWLYPLEIEFWKRMFYILMEAISSGDQSTRYMYVSNLSGLIEWQPYCKNDKWTYMDIGKTFEASSCAIYAEINLSNELIHWFLVFESRNFRHVNSFFFGWNMIIRQLYSLWLYF